MLRDKVPVVFAEFFVVVWVNDGEFSLSKGYFSEGAAISETPV